MDMRRLFLFLIFSFSLFVLWGDWVRQHQPVAPPSAAEKAPTDQSIPTAPARVAPQAAAPTTSPVAEASAAPTGKKILVTTDTFKVEINTSGGNIQGLDLLQHKDAEDQSKPLNLLHHQTGHVYVAQSGLLGKGLPTHNAEFTATGDDFRLADGKDTLEVRLTAVDSGEARVSKVYTFHRGSYLVDVAYEIENKTKEALLPSAYFQFVRDSEPVQGSSKFVPTFTGPAIYTEQDKFQKIEFADIEKNKVKLPANPDNGWIGMLQHYFVSAWLPAGKGPREFYTKQLGPKEFSAGVILPVA